MLFLCVERSASERLALQHRLEAALQYCRAAVGHIPNLQFLPLAPEELQFRLHGALEKQIAVIFGEKLSLENVLSRAREAQKTERKYQLFAFLEEQCASLQNLKRLERGGVQYLAASDGPSRIIHTLLTAKEPNSQSNQRGKLIAISGVKGGVGATSLASALAHSAHTNGQTSLLVDLSPNSALLHYFGAERWHSPEYRSALLDNTLPNYEQLKKLLITAPNGLELLLPPSGGRDIRERWLRANDALELNFTLLDSLLETYNTIIVDLSHAEGLFPFSISIRADERLLVTSNDPASIHLLIHELERQRELPLSGNLSYVTTLISDSPLTERDVASFARIPNEQVRAYSIPKDRRGSAWIGTGNSFYTEATRSTQKLIDQLYRALIFGESEQTEEQPRRSFANILKKRLNREETPALPAPLHQTSNESSERPFLLEEVIGYERPQPISTQRALQQ